MLMWIALGFVLSVLVALIIRSGRRPHYRSKPILTKNEVEFFDRIRKAAPELYIFPQVGMSALIEPTDTNKKKFMAAFGRIAQKRIDYGLFTHDMKLMGIIELDDKTHNIENDRIRDSYTQSAGIKTLRFESRARPSIATLRQAIRAIGPM